VGGRHRAPEPSETPFLLVPSPRVPAREEYDWDGIWEPEPGDVGTRSLGRLPVPPVLADRQRYAARRRLDELADR
jgi:hypothetical protein